MAFTCNPDRDNTKLPPHTDDILFVNRTNQDVYKVEYTLTYDVSATPTNLTEIFYEVGKGTLVRTRLIPKGYSIKATELVVKITLNESASAPDYTITLDELTGTGNDYIAVIVTGLIKVRPTPTSTQMIPFAEIIKKDGAGIGITIAP